MAQTLGKKLDSGDMLPHLRLDLIDSKSITVPAATEGRWSLVLFYRGDW